MRRTGTDLVFSHSTPVDGGWTTLWRSRLQDGAAGTRRRLVGSRAALRRGSDQRVVVDADDIVTLDSLPDNFEVVLADEFFRLLRCAT